MAAEIRILSTDGKLYKSELWDSSKTAQGIAVFELEQNHQFVIEVNSYDNYCSFSYDAENPSNFKFSSNSDCFLLNGYDNTQLLYPYFTANEDYAIAIAKNRNGYIGTAEEYKIIFENYNKISEALSVIGCTLYYSEMFRESMWTSNISNITADPDGNYLIVYCYNCSSDSLDKLYSDNRYGFILLYKYTGSLEENDVKPRTITENLQIIKDSTNAIKQAIIDKGGTIEGDITTWASAINGISGGGSDNLKILNFGSNGSRVYVDGMTWGEWVDSIYNTRDQQGMFYKSGGPESDVGPIYCSYGQVYRDNGAVMVLASQLISDSIIYVVMIGGGGN